MSPKFELIFENSRLRLNLFGRPPANDNVQMQLKLPSMDKRPDEQHQLLCCLCLKNKIIFHVFKNTHNTRAHLCQRADIDRSDSTAAGCLTKRYVYVHT